MDTEPIVSERKQRGSVVVRVGGRLERVPVELTIVETTWPDGRTDCTVKVPRIRAAAEHNSGR